MEEEWGERMGKILGRRKRTSKREGLGRRRDRER
jgi:hypothetical protein